MRNKRSEERHSKTTGKCPTQGNHPDDHLPRRNLSCCPDPPCLPPTVTKIPTRCWYYAKGECYRGSGCKFLHEQGPTDAPEDSESSAPTTESEEREPTPVRKVTIKRKPLPQTTPDDDDTRHKQPTKTKTHMHPKPRRHRTHLHHQKGANAKAQNAAADQEKGHHQDHEAHLKRKTPTPESRRGQGPANNITQIAPGPNHPRQKAPRNHITPNPPADTGWKHHQDRAPTTPAGENALIAQPGENHPEEKDPDGKPVPYFCPCGIRAGWGPHESHRAEAGEQPHQGRDQEDTIEHLAPKVPGNTEAAGGIPQHQGASQGRTTKGAHNTGPTEARQDIADLEARTGTQDLAGITSMKGTMTGNWKKPSTQSSTEQAAGRRR